MYRDDIGRSAWQIRPVFLVGRTYDWTDVALFAARRDEWAAFEARVRAGIAAALVAPATLPPDVEAAVEAVAARFRYDRDLLTAADTEAWLTERGSDPADWMAWVRRSVLSSRAAGADVRRDSVTAGMVARVLHAELPWSSAGRDWATALAGQAAAAAESGEPERPDEPALPAEVAAVLSRLPPLEWDAPAPRLGHLARLERVAARLEAGSVPAEVAAREVERRRLDWIRFDCRTAVFGSAAAAREAALCVTEDRLPLDRVAADARIPITESSQYLGEIDPELRPRFLGATAGDLIGPLEQDGGLAVVQVVARVAPDVVTPELIGRIHRAVRKRNLDELVQRRVRWLGG